MEKYLSFKFGRSLLLGMAVGVALPATVSAQDNQPSPDTTERQTQEPGWQRMEQGSTPSDSAPASTQETSPSQPSGAQGPIRLDSTTEDKPGASERDQPRQDDSLPARKKRDESKRDMQKEPYPTYPGSN